MLGSALLPRSKPTRPTPLWANSTTRATRNSTTAIFTCSAFNMSDFKFTAHPNPNLMGTDGRLLKFKDDPFGQRVYDAIQGSAAGSIVTIDYIFPEARNSPARSEANFSCACRQPGFGVGYYK